MRQEAEDQGPWEIEFYETAMGRIPVFEWIEKMPAPEKALALNHLDLLALAGKEARPPLVAPLRDKIFELRWKGYGRQNRIAYFAFTGRKFVLLHAITKKTAAWSEREFQIAKQRMKDYEERHGL